MSELEIANTEMKRNLEDVKKEKNKLNKERDALQTDIAERNRRLNQIEYNLE